MRSWMVGLVAVAAGLVVPATSAAQVPDLDLRPASKSIDAGRTDGLLTSPSKADPERIALDYVREHFALADADVDNLKLVARAVSPDGITHLRFNQTLDGIESYDSGIDAHVTRDGRLITVNGAPVRGASLKDKTPAVSALAGLGEARRTTRGLALPPRVTKSSRAAATFATGEAAKLRWIAVGGKPRLAWDIYAEGGESSYTVLVDAESGDTLVRKDLTEHVGGARYFPRDPDTSPITQITMPPSWYDQNNGGTRLWGQYSRTYIDPNDQDPAPGSEEGGTRRQIPESSPGSRDWLYTRTTFPAATPCPVGGCAWDSTIAASRDTNQFQAATNVHVLVGRFSEYLAQAPIGFDEASGNFQRVNASGAGLGNDYIRTEVNDGQGFNNANFATPSDGNAPRMQMYLFTGRNANGSDVADVVYHEIGHGLSNRLIVNASGSGALNAIQGSMMGEAWSDFYALDLLQSQGWVTDTAARGRHHRQPRLRAERHPLQADRLPGRARRLRQLRPQRHGHHGAGRLHLRRPHPHQQRRRTAQRRRGVGRDAVGPPPGGRPRRRAGADHRRHAADRRQPVDDRRARRDHPAGARDALRPGRAERLLPRGLGGVPRPRHGLRRDDQRARGHGSRRELQRAVERALPPRAGAARRLPGRRQRRPLRARRARPGLRARVLRGPDRPARRDRDAQLPDGDDRGRERDLGAAGQGADVSQRRPARRTDARRLRGGCAVHGHRDLARD